MFWLVPEKLRDSENSKAFVPSNERTVHGVCSFRNTAIGTAESNKHLEAHSKSKWIVNVR